MSAKGWSWKEQRADAEHAFRELKKASGLREGAPIELELHFLPDDDDADPAALLRALRAAGYAAAALEDGAVEATASGARFELEKIWRHEERASRLALSHGYAPDGWGF